MSIATELQTLITKVTGAELPVRLRAWDGSEAGPEMGTGPVLIIRDQAALRRLLWRPTELGLAQAYIQGEIDVDGDIAIGLQRMWALADSASVPSNWRSRLAALPAAKKFNALGLRPAEPNLEVEVDGELHSRTRDKEVISFHYDLSNNFYALILDPAMVYSCGYWTSDAPGYTLEQAQSDKLDLICRKLGLNPGMRLLDVGCGWGALALHAAQHYGVTVTAATLSEQQHAEATKRAKENGLEELVDFRLTDYRDIEKSDFDAISTIEMGEHVGKDEYPNFARQLRTFLKPGGRLLIQQMSRGDVDPGGGEFIETYIVPDMHMRPLGETVSILEGAGLEVRNVEAMREHYVHTINAWRDTLEEKWDEVETLLGPKLARVWRLYLVGGALSFQHGHMGVDQIVATVPLETGDSALPPLPDWYQREPHR